MAFTIWNFLNDVFLIIKKHPDGRCIFVVELTGTDSPDEGGQEADGNQQTDGNEDKDDVHGWLSEIGSGKQI
ncbi:MAG TPA: hypothetical protein PLW31_07820 [Bacteroidales bacterium]|nr:hypothetical protein [Bacteroidales bacterium]HOX77932.1 hypothetical protein [Bacteroidales bacterium]